MTRIMERGEYLSLLTPFGEKKIPFYSSNLMAVQRTKEAIKITSPLTLHTHGFVPSDCPSDISNTRPFYFSSSWYVSYNFLQKFSFPKNPTYKCSYNFCWSIICKFDHLTSITYNSYYSLY